MLSGYAIDQHVRLGGDNRGIDETQEEETTDEGADGVICGLWIFPLSSDVSRWE